MGPDRRRPAHRQGRTGLAQALTLVAGRYRLERRLDSAPPEPATGAARSEVWLALDLRTGLRRALKLGTRAPAAWPRHPGLIEVIGSGRHDGLHYTVMPALRGRTLAAILAEGPLPPPEAARILLAVSEAVEALHSSGCVHGDLRPANVHVALDGRVTLLDPEEPGPAGDRHGDRAALDALGRLLAG